MGRLVDTLDELKIRERTFIIFTTDNGTSGNLRGTVNGVRPSGGKASKYEGGVSEPFIVNCPGTVAAGSETDALTDFSDLLPTFAELGGATLPADTVSDGVSIAPVILGKADDTPRKWILAMGHGAAVFDERGIHGQTPYVGRVLRDKRWKVWVNEQGQIDQLYDMQQDPLEQTNLLAADGTGPAAAAASLKILREAVAAMPAQDAQPRYLPRAANSWDMKPKSSADRNAKPRQKKRRGKE